MIVMSKLFALSRVAAGMAVGSALLAGCAAGPKSLYQWEGYQPQVYEYFKGESKEAQVAELRARPGKDQVGQRRRAAGLSRPTGPAVFEPGQG